MFSGYILLRIETVNDGSVSERHTGVILECRKASLLCNSLHGAMEECFSSSSLSTIPLPLAEQSNFFSFFENFHGCTQCTSSIPTPYSTSIFSQRDRPLYPTPTSMPSFHSGLRPFSVVYMCMLVVSFTRVWSLAGTTSLRTTAYPSCPGCLKVPQLELGHHGTPSIHAGTGTGFSMCKWAFIMAESS